MAISSLHAGHQCVLLVSQRPFMCSMAIGEGLGAPPSSFPSWSCALLPCPGPSPTPFCTIDDWRSVCVCLVLSDEGAAIRSRSYSPFLLVFLYLPSQEGKLEHGGFGALTCSPSPSSPHTDLRIGDWVSPFMGRCRHLPSLSVERVEGVLHPPPLSSPNVG